MLKRIIFYVVGVLIICLLFWVYNQGKKTEIINQQKERLIIQNEIIETKKNIQHRKAIVKSVSVNDNLQWLRQARCKDCQV